MNRENSDKNTNPQRIGLTEDEFIQMLVDDIKEEAARLCLHGKPESQAIDEIIKFVESLGLLQRTTITLMSCMVSLVARSSQSESK